MKSQIQTRIKINNLNKLKFKIMNNKNLHKITHNNKFFNLKT